MRLMIHTAKRPSAKPMMAPKKNWMARSLRMTAQLMPSEVMTWMRTMVSMYAMGSLLPLSSSSMGRRLCLRFMRCERRRLNTDAESVDDMVAASRREVVSGREMLVLSHPEM